MSDSKKLVSVFWPTALFDTNEKRLALSQALLKNNLQMAVVYNHVDTYPNNSEDLPDFMNKTLESVSDIFSLNQIVIAGNVPEPLIDTMKQYCNDKNYLFVKPTLLDNGSIHLDFYNATIHTQVTSDLNK